MGRPAGIPDCNPSILDKGTYRIYVTDLVSSIGLLPDEIIHTVNMTASRVIVHNMRSYKVQAALDYCRV